MKMETEIRVIWVWRLILCVSLTVPDTWSNLILGVSRRD